MSGGALYEPLALLFRPFAVHQVVDGLARRPPRAPQQPCGDAEPEQWIGLGKAEVRIDRQRRDHREVEQQVGLIVHTVGADRERPGAADHVALPGEQGEGRENRRHRHRDALFCRLDPAAFDQVEHGPEHDRRSGQRDQDHLQHRGKRLCLAVSEAVLLVGRHRGDPHAGQRRQARDEVERGVGEASQHRRRARARQGPGLESGKEQRQRNRRERRAAVQPGVARVHGYSSVLAHPPAVRVNSRRSCRRCGRESQNSIRSGARRKPVQWRGRGTAPSGYSLRKVSTRLR